MGKVLVLNASYEPLNITSWRRAVVLLLKGKAEQIEHNGRVVYGNIPLPTVIRLRHYVHVPHKEIPLTRRNVLYRDGHRCQYCGCFGEDLTLDHVIPRSRGGGDTWENVVSACVRCNVKKGNRTPREAGMPLLRQPRRPHSTLYFEISKAVGSGSHREWSKYTIGLEGDPQGESLDNPS
ncbi:HNH endonuclease [Synechococcus sp. W55.1]|jgi:5-methylcytosine-specific restriction endonuclease McrA|uniref:HNH endonuclease n=1 Tax=Synechococcus sp. W55.1 TaxID=2964512 RepID=UPI0039C445B8